MNGMCGRKNLDDFELQPIRLRKKYAALKYAIYFGFIDQSHCKYFVFK